MKPKIVIIDYDMGNLNSVLKALKRVGVTAVVSSDAKEIESADKIILPGVGYFKKAMENLSRLNLIQILKKKILEDKTPILGICLGMQLLGKFSEEGGVEGLGLINAKTIRFNFNKPRIPHMGWNSIKIQKFSRILEGVEEDASFYFVHSYHVVCENKKDSLTKTSYGIEFNSAIEKENIFGTQFHPEKSHKIGLKILSNFIKNV